LALPLLNRLVIDPARLGICTILYVEEEADFDRLIKSLKLTAGNLAGHMRKLESAGYVEVVKEFIGRRPHTKYRLTESGRKAFEDTINQLRYIVGLSRVLPK
jgi:DNA-binding MarR family transcriptional regulator